MFIYTIGSLTYYYRTKQSEKGHIWREMLKQWASDNGVKVFDPASTYAKESNHSYNPKLCVEQNNYYIDKCDIAVVNMDCLEESPGSIYELVRFKELGKPVIAFGKSKWDWSPHIQYCISHQCETLEEVIELLSNMFNQGNF